MILIKVLRVKEYRPLSRTTRINILQEHLSIEEMNLLETQFAKYLIGVIRYNVDQAIVKQKLGPRTFYSRYKPLSKRWKAAKKRHGLAQGFWRATTFLQNNIRIWQAGEVSYIGFPDNIIHPRNGQSLHIISLALELGSKKRNIPARPLFKPVSENISKNIFAYFTQFIKLFHPEYEQFI